MDIFEKIESLGYLSEGWDYGLGVPACSSCVKNTKLLTSFLHSIGVLEFDCFPGQDGSVMLVAYRENQSVEIECFLNDKFELSYEDSNGLNDPVGCASFNEVFELLRKLGWWSNRLFVSCTRNAMMPVNNVTIRPHFVILPMEDSLSFVANASPHPGCQNVTTFANTTPRTFVESHPSSGDLPFPIWERQSA